LASGWVTAPRSALTVPPIAPSRVSDATQVVVPLGETATDVDAVPSVQARVMPAVPVSSNC